MKWQFMMANYEIVESIALMQYLIDKTIIRMEIKITVGYTL